MDIGIAFFFNSILLGIGLAMDAFSVSLANGLNEPEMKPGRLCTVAGVFSAFQFLMPMLGWVCVSTAAKYFKLFERFIPWIALVLLSYIGIKMLCEGIKNNGDTAQRPAVGIRALLVQGIATSIDALSVGFTISHYAFAEALAACLLIGAVTFVICAVGLVLGKTFGTKLAGKAGILGGAILIFIGLEIFISSLI